MHIEFANTAATAAILKIAASFAAGAIDGRRFLLLKAADQGVTITVAGEDGQITLNLPGVTTGTGQVALRADLLSALFSKIAGGSCVLTVKKASAVITQGRNRYVLKALDNVDDCGITAMAPPDLELTLPVDQFLGAIAYAQHAMARSDVRYYLNGMHFNLSRAGLAVEATDGHRAARTIEKVDAAKPAQYGKAIISFRTVPKIAAALATMGDDTLRLAFTPDGYSIRTDSMSLFGKAIVGSFPDVSRVIPGEFQAVTLNARALVTALDRTGLLVDGNRYAWYAWIDLARDGDDVVFTYVSDAGEAEEHIEADYAGAAGIDVRLDPRYLRDAAAAVGTELIRLRISNDPNMAIRWEPASGDRVGVIMPQRR